MRRRYTGKVHPLKALGWPLHREMKKRGLLKMWIIYTKEKNGLFLDICMLKIICFTVFLPSIFVGIFFGTPSMLFMQLARFHQDSKLLSRESHDSMAILMRNKTQVEYWILFTREEFRAQIQLLFRYSLYISALNLE